MGGYSTVRSRSEYWLNGHGTAIQAASSADEDGLGRVPDHNIRGAKPGGCWRAGIQHDPQQFTVFRVFLDIRKERTVWREDRLTIRNHSEYFSSGKVVKPGVDGASHFAPGPGYRSALLSVKTGAFSGRRIIHPFGPDKRSRRLIVANR
jgi:hypothetical protein